jgi:hypothetical protein
MLLILVSSSLVHKGELYDDGKGQNAIQVKIKIVRTVAEY